MTALLDANVLIALTVEDHRQHATALSWFRARTDPFATCPLTQGALLRTILREGGSATQALDVIAALTADPGHQFWSGSIGYDQVSLRGVVGHRQVTDAYLAALSRHRDAQLATFDRGVALVHPDVALLLPVDTTTPAQADASTDLAHPVSCGLVELVAESRPSRLRPARAPPQRAPGTALGS